MHTNHSTAFAARVSSTTDLGWLLTLCRIGNRRQRHLAGVRLRALAPRVMAPVKVAPAAVLVAPKKAPEVKAALSPEEIKAKRSAAAKKAAATRKARMAAQATA